MKPNALLAAAAALAISGFGAYAVSRTADAQDQAPVEMADAARSGPAQSGPGWRHDGPGGHHRWMMAHDGQHRGPGLFYAVADKNLSVADVQTIAQAMLLRHGNHSWKVIDVAQNQDHTVSFAFATGDGGTVARFSVDTQTGRMQRIS